MLIDAGADINTHSRGYGIPLQAASWEGDGKVMQMLMDAGVDMYP